MIGPTDLLHLSPAPHFKSFEIYIYILQCSRRHLLRHCDVCTSACSLKVALKKLKFVAQYWNKVVLDCILLHYLINGTVFFVYCPFRLYAFGSCPYKGSAVFAVLYAIKMKWEVIATYNVGQSCDWHIAVFQHDSRAHWCVCPMLVRV